jgi:para-nitrobenzyl esterase
MQVPGTERTWRGLVAAALSLTVIAALASSARSVAAPDGKTTDKERAGLVVATPYGKLEGRRLGGAHAFLGVPFAKPPVYSLAWRAPVAPSKWNGVHDATKKAPACVQYQSTGIKNSEPSSADCLYLDVYRPAHVKRTDKLPVMVFFHGGAATQGAGRLYGGQTMARRTHTIIVSTNYRLGAAGNLALPALTAENSATGGNFALLDQVQALRWVKKSIGAFGGDRKNVAIFGQSAGARAVCNLLATPLSRGLFDSAIMESSPCLGGGTTRAAAASSEEYAAAVGCPSGADQLACLRKAWPGDLVRAFGDARPAAYVGAAALPQASGDAIAAGKWHKVPVIVGNTRWEQKLQNQQFAGIDAEEYRDLVIEKFGDEDGAKVLEEYPASAYAKPFYALAAMRTDAGAGCQIDTNAKLFLGQGVPVYRYEFDDPTSPTLFGFQPPGIDMSSAHSAELAYLFDFTLGDRPLTKKQMALSRAMQDYWTGFAKYGKPNAPGRLVWPRYYATTDKALRLGPRTSVTTGLYEEHNCASFAGLGE